MKPEVTIPRYLVENGVVPQPGEGWELDPVRDCWRRMPTAKHEDGAGGNAPRIRAGHAQ